MTNGQKIQVLFLLIIILSLLVTLLVNKLRKVLQEKERNSLFLAGKRRTGKRYINLYDIFFHWPVTKQFTRKITEQYQVIFPEDWDEIKKQTSKTILLLFLLDLILFVILFALKPSLYKTIITITFIYVVNNHSIYLILQKNKVKLEEQIKSSFDDIKHWYQGHEMVDEAVYQALETAPYPVNLHLKKIYDVISSEEPEEASYIYFDIAPNRYLKMFTSLCVLMMKFGDKKIDKKTIFLANLGDLKKELNSEITWKKKARWLFSGLVLLDIVPILFIEVIRDWAVKCFSNLVEYYSGAFGIATVVLIFLTTIGGYNLINRLRDMDKVDTKSYVILEWLSKIPPFRNIIENIINRNYGRSAKLSILLKRSGDAITINQFLMKRILYAVVTFLSCIVIFFSIHVQKRDIYLHNVESVNYYGSVLSETQEENVKNVIIQYVNEYKSSDISKENLEDELIRENVLRSRELATLTADEISNRIHSYQNEYFRWYELFVAIMLSAISYHIPYFILVMMKGIRERVMEDEVIQYYSIISMLMYIDQMTIQTILEWMEIFGNVFKASIQKCLNDLQEGDVEALETLKENEPFQPFQRLIESIQMCDILPMEKAFDEIAADREDYQENRKVENEILTTDRSVIGKLVASIPAGITIGFYLIVPWVIEGLTYFFNQMDQINSIY